MEYFPSNPWIGNWSKIISLKSLIAYWITSWVPVYLPLITTHFGICENGLLVYVSYSNQIGSIGFLYKYCIHTGFWIQTQHITDSVVWVCIACHACIWKWWCLHVLRPICCWNMHSFWNKRKFQRKKRLHKLIDCKHN